MHRRPIEGRHLVSPEDVGCIMLPLTCVYVCMYVFGKQVTLFCVTLRRCDTQSVTPILHAKGVSSALKLRRCGYARIWTARCGETLFSCGKHY